MQSDFEWDCVFGFGIGRHIIGGVEMIDFGASRKDERCEQQCRIQPYSEVPPDVV